MAKTDDNLKAAFAGESQANRKYTVFAEKAAQEQFPTVARLFRAAAAAEAVHAGNHLRAMRGVGTTLENVKAAASGESAEFREMYPAFIEQAKKDGNDVARKTFDYANQVEKIHHGFYNKAADSLGKGKDLPATKYFVCRGCGNTVEGEAPEKCSICGAPKSWFMQIE